MPKFKVGDEVVIRCNENRETDFLADLQSALTERDISGRTYDTLVKAIENRNVWRVTSVEVDSEEFATYEIQVRKTKTKAPFMVEESDLEAVLFK